MIWLTAVAWAGTLSGTVSSADGVPVRDAVVVVYDQRLNYATELTTFLGGFEIDDLPANPYRVRVIPDSRDTLQEGWFPEGLSLCNGERVFVPKEGEAEVHTTLVEGGVLSGRVVDLGGVPIPGVEVATRTTRSTSTVVSRRSISDLEGEFVVRGIPFEAETHGDVRLRFTVPGWPEQLLGQVYEEEDGEILEIYPGEPVELGDVALLDGVRVSGTVRGPDGPLFAGTAHVYSPNEVVTVPIIDGGFAAQGLPPGEVLVWATGDGHATTYFPDVDRPGERLQALEEGEEIRDVALELPRAARVSGRVLGDGDLSGVSLLAYNDARTVGFGASVSEDGSFVVDGLHGGDYTVQAYAAAEGYLDDLVRDPGGAPLVLGVPDEGELAADLPLTQGGTISGTVRDRYSGEPILGAFVIVTGQASQAAPGQTVSYATATESDGTYVLRGVRPGIWELRVDYQAYCLADWDWVTVYYPGHINTVLSVGVEVQPGTEVIWDAEVPPDHDHDRMDDVWEREVGLDPNREDGDEDPDGDGFSNLEEYLLGTDPLQFVPDRVCGCRGSGAWLLLLPLGLWRRRQRLGQDLSPLRTPDRIG